jgi:hypothetical protein
MNKPRKDEVIKYDTETDDEREQWERVLDMAEHIDKGEGFVYGDLYEDERL